MQTLAPASAAATAAVNPAPPEPITTMSYVRSHFLGTGLTFIASAEEETNAVAAEVDTAAKFVRKDLRVKAQFMVGISKDYNY